MKKNIVFAIYSLLMSFMFLFLNSCDKDDNKIDKSKLIPQLSTAEVKNVRLTSAESGGNITSDGGSSITQRGVCWGLSANPTTKDNKTTDDAEAGAFNSEIKSLASGTTYYLRAYATNGYGTGYGNEFTFTTQKHGSAGKVTDIDGNVYNTIVIGTQEWMAENLKTSKLNDGTHITLEESDVYEEYIRKIPIYSWYDSKESNGRKYGRLYNWYSIASKMLCPVGWHVPTDNEWIVLVDYLGGNKIAGGKMKNIGTDDWASPNKGATNESC